MCYVNDPVKMPPPPLCLICPTSTPPPNVIMVSYIEISNLFSFLSNYIISYIGRATMDGEDDHLGSQ